VILIGFSLYHQGIPVFTSITNGFSMFSDGNITSNELERLRNATIFYYPSEEHLGEMKPIPNYWNGLPNPAVTTYPVDNPLAGPTMKKYGGLIVGIVGGVMGAVISIDLGAEWTREKKKR
jgi:hypothetical protein